MHHGVWGQDSNILILGESHHTSDDYPQAGIPAPYTTESVVKEHILDINNSKKSLYFFKKIANSFGYESETKEQREDFWNKVYFGNYIDVLCGVGDSKAKIHLQTNRIKCNDQLFAFINENDITKVFVFSRLVFNNLPSLSRKFFKEENIQNRINDKNIMVGKCSDYIGHCKYLRGIEHNNSNMLLNHDVDFYGLRHPSARGGYSADNYKEYLNKLL